MVRKYNRSSNKYISQIWFTEYVLCVLYVKCEVRILYMKLQIYFVELLTLLVKTSI